MLKENNLVLANRNLSEIVQQNCIGTIVFVYNEPRLAYEVEFVDINRNPLELLTVEPDEIREFTLN